MNYIVDYYGVLKIYDGDKLIAVVRNFGELSDDQLQVLVNKIVSDKAKEVNNG